jgi:pimeloyl-ACP methyl ester carboxylesterase
MATVGWDELAAMAADHRSFAPPSKFLLFAEYRFVWELGLSVAAAPLLLRAPRGDGQPVLVLPGFLASDLSTNLLRNYLKRLGYDPYAWNLGRNLGGVIKMRGLLHDRLAEIAENTGRKVSVIGWSLGGIYARLLGHDLPSKVRSVITLGSPFSRDPKASNVGKLYHLMTGEGLTDEEKTAHMMFPHEFDRIVGDLSMPATSIFTKGDGVVSWRACLIHANRHAENVEVLGASHIGLGVNPAVLWAVADRLALPEGTFEPFERNGPFGLAYGKPISLEDV